MKISFVYIFTVEEIYACITIKVPHEVKGQWELARGGLYQILLYYTKTYHFHGFEKFVWQIFTKKHNI